MDARFGHFTGKVNDIRQGGDREIAVKPEEKARKDIDKLLEAAGWQVQDFEKLNLGSSLGVAVREFPLGKDSADYLLFVDRKAVGAIEAKAKGMTLGGVAEQSQKYVTNLPGDLPRVQEPLPFAYESTGAETFFRDLRDPEPRSRRVFAFHTPETLLDRISKKQTLRKKLTQLPPLNIEGLRACQVDVRRGTS
jgi:type I restriction enzyme R subunit